MVQLAPSVLEMLASTYGLYPSQVPSVQGIFQARKLEGVLLLYQGSSHPRIEPTSLHVCWQADSLPLAPWKALAAKMALPA